MPVVAVSNQKGGVGKTTSTLNLGAALREAGKRVLLLDLDPQGNLSVAAGLQDVDSLYPSVGDLLMIAARGKPVKGVTIDDAIQASPSGLDIVPSNGTLSAAELGLVSAMNRESALANLLKPVVARYDYVLIDCLPSLGLLAINALRASDGVVIPVQADFLAVQGLAQIFETIAAVREQLNPELKIYGVLLTMVDQRTAHARDTVELVRQSLQGEINVFDTEIRLAVVLKETAKVGRSILEHDPGSASAEAYRSLARELLAAAGDAPNRDAPLTQRLSAAPATTTTPAAATAGEPEESEESGATELAAAAPATEMPPAAEPVLQPGPAPAVAASARPDALSPPAAAPAEPALPAAPPLPASAPSLQPVPPFQPAPPPARAEPVLQPASAAAVSAPVETPWSEESATAGLLGEHRQHEPSAEELAAATLGNGSAGVEALASAGNGSREAAPLLFGDFLEGRETWLGSASR